MDPKLPKESSADQKIKIEKRQLCDPRWDAWRLYLAGFAVSACFSSILFLIPLPLLSYSGLNTLQSWYQVLENQLAQTSGSKDFSVLVKQEEILEKGDAKKLVRQPRALSDVDSLGQGGITQEAGFHTGVTGRDSLEQNFEKNAQTKLGNQGRIREKNNRTAAKVSDNSATPRDLLTTGTPEKFVFYQDLDAQSQISFTFHRKIPTNYRFRDDFTLRFSADGELLLPRKKIAGFRFFRRMITRLRSTFTPPGLNFSYRDSAGTVMGVLIHPQIVQVLFALQKNGDVLDARIYASAGDRAVDAACIATLENKNFGTPPPEIFAQGNIFGISFIFPAPPRSSGEE